MYELCYYTNDENIILGEPITAITTFLLIMGQCTIASLDRSKL